MKKRRAFTLIELLIVTAIVPVIAVALVSLVSKIGQSREYFRDHLDQREAEAQVLRMWREDVALATEIKPSADPSSFALVRLDAAGAPLSVRYLRENDSIYRVAESLAQKPNAPRQKLAEEVTSLRFSASASPCSIEWTTEYRDGASVRPRTHSGLATPLKTPLAKEKSI